jgi:hypothetical protein
MQEYANGAGIILAPCPIDAASALDQSDSKGQDIGEFDEMMIDVHRGRIVLVSHGGFPGIDKNEVTPIALSISPYRTSYRLVTFEGFNEALDNGCAFPI